MAFLICSEGVTPVIVSVVRGFTNRFSYQALLQKRKFFHLCEYSDETQFNQTTLPAEMLICATTSQLIWL